MNCNTGEVMEMAEMVRQVELRPSMRKFYKEVPYQRTTPKTGRNELCPCQSGKKFKHCCYMSLIP